MALRERSISLPIVLASVAVALSIALLVGWTLVFSRYIVLSKEVSSGVSLLVLGILSFVVIMTVMILIAVFLVREILDSRKQYRFMDSVTHELKSPLASMRLSAQTMANPKVKPEQQEKLRAMILTDVDRLTSVIDDILQASRLDSRAGKMSWIEVDIATLVDDVLSAVTRRYQLDEGQLANEVSPAVRVRTDRSAFAIVISNLVDNAVKYSDAPRDVRIVLYRSTRGGANLCVHDNGIGIEEAELRRVRRRFYRVPNERTRARHGTGLGLYVVAGLARRLGIGLTIRSKGDSRGTTMILHLAKSNLRGIPEQLPVWREAADG